jgi:large subunit ribosomal protein L28
MARVCQVTGKTPIGGHKVSHSNIKTKRRFLPNLQTKRFFLAEENKWVVLKLSADGIRTINKRGLLNVVKELRAQGQHIKFINKYEMVKMARCVHFHIC